MSQKEDIFKDERIEVVIRASVGSPLGHLEITRFVSGVQARKILKVLLQGIKHKGSE